MFVFVGTKTFGVVSARRAIAASVSELKNSILTNGFLPFERIVVKEHNADANRYLLHEGTVESQL